MLPFWIAAAPWALAQAPPEDAPAPTELPEPPPEPTDPTEPTGPTAADLAAIEAALAADAAERAARAPEPPASLGVSTPTGTGSPTQSAVSADLSFIADVALAAFSSSEASQPGAHDPTTNGFNLQQLEMAISGAVDPYLRFDANVVFGQFGVEIEEVYATTTSLPGSVQLRAGQFLTRYGRINATHPHTWDFVDQNLMIARYMGGEGNRGLGAEASVLLPLPWYVELVGSQTMANGAATARSFYGAQDLGVRSPLDLQTTVAGKQFFPLSDDWSLLWGLSWATGPNPTGRANRTDLYGTDLFLKFRPISYGSWTQAWLHAEWSARRTQVPDELVTDHIGFVSAFWRFARRYGVAARYEYGSPSFGLDGVERADPSDPAWQGFRQRISAAATFWPTEFSRLRLQGSSDTMDWVPDPVLAGFLALEFNVGAHGAHRF